MLCGKREAVKERVFAAGLPTLAIARNVATVVKAHQLQLASSAGVSGAPKLQLASAALVRDSCVLLTRALADDDFSIMVSSSV